jgi:Ca2+-binding EF-hand superfamily protein/RNA polymerase subunit RPABC4/transcription elongation factor Spt4
MAEVVKDANMAECGACREIISIDSAACPKCGVSFGGVSDESLGACGACGGLAPLDANKCPHCGVSFVADNVIEVLGNWLTATGLGVRALFERFDENKDGVINAFEFKKGLLALNIADLPPSQIDRLIETLDEDNDGTIDLGELENTFSGGEPVKTVAAATSDVADEGDEEKSDDETEDDADSGPDPGDDGDADDADADADSDDDSKSDDEEDADSDDDSKSDDEEDDESDDDSKSDDKEDDDSDDDSKSDDGGDDESDDDSKSDDEEDDESDDDSKSDDEEDDESDDEEDDMAAFRRLGQAIADSDLSIREVFEAMDANDDGKIDGPELQKGIKKIGGENLSPQDVFNILKTLDEDDDGRLDPMELVTALEDLDLNIAADTEPATEAKPEKEFPTNLQKMLMSKKWNDAFWPLIHAAFGVIAVIWLVNGIIGPVDGTGGQVAFDGAEPTWSTNENTTILPGEMYSCDKEIQVSKCANSLTLLSGDSSSMPVGFYWDGILFTMIGLLGLGGSLFMHFSVVKSWRAQARVLKGDDDSDDEDDSDAGDDEDADDAEGDGDDADDADDEDDEDDAEDDDEADGDDEADDDETDDDEADDDDEGEGEIDIGSRIGIEVDGVDVFGKIIEFDDEAGTVIIEDEDTGEEIEAPQDEMFVE